MIPRTARPEEIAAQFGVSRESLVGLEAYAATLLKWNQRINLIGPATITDLWHRHIADGLQLLPIMGKIPGSQTIVDLGSGGGVPGLVLAIARPEFKVHLVESNNKKAAFLREAARLAGASVQVHAVRIETFTKAWTGELNWVTARALAPLNELLELASPLLAKAPALFHKGQDVDAELTAATKCWKMEYKKHASLVDRQSVVLEISKAGPRNGNEA